MEKQQTHLREFGGIFNTTGLPKEQRNFEKKHFKAFLQGHESFCFGYEKGAIIGQDRPRKWFNVKVNYIENPLSITK